MTDNEIIKALEEELKTALIINHRFEESNDTENPDDHRFIALLSRTIKLINRQKAEIERSKGSVQEWVDGKCLSQKHLLMIGKLQNEIEQTKAKAIKEFAERLKQNSRKTGMILRGTHWEDKYTITDVELDNLVKEMVGDT